MQWLGSAVDGAAGALAREGAVPREVSSLALAFPALLAREGQREGCPPLLAARVGPGGECSIWLRGSLALA